jgi:hypothetical protein
MLARQWLDPQSGSGDAMLQCQAKRLQANLAASGRHAATNTNPIFGDALFPLLLREVSEAIEQRTGRSANEQQADIEADETTGVDVVLVHGLQVRLMAQFSPSLSYTRPIPL